MKIALRKLPLLLIALLCSLNSHGQSPIFWLTITDSAAIDHIDTIAGNYIPTFTDPAVQGTFSGGGGGVVVSIEQAMPNADDLCLRWLWRVTGADSAFMNTLVTTYPVLFPGYMLMPQFDTLGYTPNDWDKLGQGGVDYLDFIGAREAWEYDPAHGKFGTKGDPTVIIGIVDDYFDTTNVDVKSNSVKIITGNHSSSHGTEVAGVAAGRTDNDTTLPSIGFRCRMNLSGNIDQYSALQHLIQDNTGGRVRVTNLSHGGEITGPLQINGVMPVLCDDIYEAGVTGVFSAGNGLKSGTTTYSYYYPASYDFNISVTSVGHLTDTGALHQKDIHEAAGIGDSTLTHQHNDRVDICAPGWAFILQGVGNSWTRSAGTSYAAPVVAGTCALMYSQQSCLTPYQVEYLLKTTSKDIYQETHDGGAHYYNARYYDGVSRYSSRLGAGRLQADQAVFAASSSNFQCNDSATRTMFIDGVTLTHNCAPGTVPGLDSPRLIIGEIHNGVASVAGYRYLWTPLPLSGNTVTLSSYTAASPRITGVTSPGAIPVAYFRLAVYDNSEIQKVASIRFRIPLIHDTVSDLAMRDSYFDMLDQPNSQFTVNRQHDDIWHSPDFWNRDTITVDSLIPEEPEYFTGAPNYLFVRVRNVGCIANHADASKLKLYWTYGATGERWPDDWIGATTVQGDLTPTTPAGALINDSTVIPVLQPGRDTILRVAWYPPDPKLRFGRPPQVGVCILARLLETTQPDSGLYIPDASITRTATNVNNNNNIVTRNFALVNLGKACASCRTTSSTSTSTHRMYVKNAEDHDQVFTVEMLSQKDIQKYLSGDISKYCYVSLALGDLYDLWQEAGGHGHYMSKDAETRTVTYDPSSPLRLEGINLPPGKHFPVDITFVLRSGVKVPFAVKDFNLYIRQLINEGKSNSVYGAMVYNINIAATETRRPNLQSSGGDNNMEASPYYTVYPNPVSGTLSIRYTGTKKTIADISLTDITGKTITRKAGIAMQTGFVYQIKMSQFAAGTYLIHIDDNNGNKGVQKITKD